MIVGDPVLLGGVVCIIVGCCVGSPTCLGVLTPFMCCWEVLWLCDVGEVVCVRLFGSEVVGWWGGGGKSIRGFP